ncbi:SRPBCC family protein [Spongisporangium articulatum]|uniref:SRPBCC family protein n=1 Tax=Spongisporangium articulatum TaxID=3362603 RepID=A0ABW8ASU0_9ACTN
MADRTESSIVVAAAPAAVLDVIADFESYPEWTGAVKQVEILEALPDGRGKRVRFALDAGAIRDTYVLDYDWGVDDSGVGALSWTLEESTVLRALNGTYELSDAPGGATNVRYELSVDLRIPMLGMLRRKAERTIIDTALSELKKRVEG